MKHLTVEKQERTEGLVLGGSGHVLLHGQVGEEGFDLGAAISLGWRLSWNRMKRVIHPT